jgi:hypothetical protein
VLRDVQVARSGDGAYRLASDGTGLALTRPDESLGPRATFRVRVIPRAGFPSNGLLALGDAPEDEKLVKCGLFVGGNYAAVYEGTYPSDDAARLTMPLSGGRPYELVVRVDLGEGTVQMRVGQQRVTKKLTRKIDAIRYYGYAAITTDSEFGKIEVADE